jgi:hypothetical protein
MIRVFLILISILCLLVGCSDSVTNPATLKAENQVALQKPEVVGTTDDGQEVKRYKVNNPEYADGCAPHDYPHYIYVVGATVTVNKMERYGKQNRNSVVIIFNGKTNTFELEDSK